MYYYLSSFTLFCCTGRNNYRNDLTVDTGPSFSDDCVKVSIFRLRIFARRQLPQYFYVIEKTTSLITPHNESTIPNANCKNKAQIIWIRLPPSAAWCSVAYCLSISPKGLVALWQSLAILLCCGGAPVPQSSLTIAHMGRVLNWPPGPCALYKQVLALNKMCKFAGCSTFLHTYDRIKYISN